MTRRQIGQDNERMDKAVEKAKGAFFQSLVESYPEITTGDIDPLESHAFDEACTAIVTDWLYWNLHTEKQ